MKQRNFFNRTRRIFCTIVAIVALVAGFGILPGAVFGQAATTASPLKIGIIGSGHIGGALGVLWAKSGHEILFSSRHPEALVEYAEAVSYYIRKGAIGAADAFVSTVESAIADIASAPDRWRV